MLSRGILLIYTDDENVKSESSVDESFEYYFHLKGECLIKLSLTETVSFKNVFEEISVYILSTVPFLFLMFFAKVLDLSESFSEKSLLAGL